MSMRQLHMLGYTLMLLGIAIHGPWGWLPMVAAAVIGAVTWRMTR